MYAVLDVETTGLSNKDRVIEIAIAHVDGDGRVTDRWETLVNPKRDLGPQELHGIRSADVRKAPTFDQIAGEAIARLNGRIPVAHNLAFDNRLLAHEYLRLGQELPDLVDVGVCTMQWANYFLPGSGRSLGDCCLAAGIANHRPHAAMSDVLATAELLALYLNSMGPEPMWADRDELVHQLRWPTFPSGLAEPVCRGAGVDDGADFLARLVDRIPRVPDPPQADTYLALLDRALLDRHVSATEADALVELAGRLGIGTSTAAELHHGYLSALAAAALADGVVTEAERHDLERVAALLSLPTDAVEAVLRSGLEVELPTGGPEFRLQVGDPIVLTGSFAESKQHWAHRLETAGLQVKPTVTKKTVLVVAADPDSMSGKAAKARQYGIPVIGVESLDLVLARISSESHAH